MPTSLVPLFPGLPGGPEMIVILLIVVLLFGANKLPKLARSSGQAMGEFKKGREEIEDELQDMRGDESFDNNNDDDSLSNDDDSFSSEGGFEQANTQGQQQGQQNQQQRSQNQQQRSQNQRSQNQQQHSGQSNTGGWGTSTETGRERDRR